MILYLLFLVLSAILTFIALGFIVGGLVKGNKQVWISALVAFVLLTLVTVFAGYTYVKETINYMGSDEFQEETRKKAENVGKTWGNTVTGTAQGLEATLDDDAIAKLANKGAKIVGKGVKAAATGMDETVGKTTVFLDESADREGVAIGRAEQITDSLKHSFGLFLEFNKDFNGTLSLTAYDSEGKKQDKAELPFKEKAGKAKVYVFQFDYFKPGMSGYCVLAKE